MTQGGPDLDGRSLLVVGGAGFVGANLVRRALRRGRRATSPSSTTCCRPSAGRCRTTPRVAFVEGSIADDAVLAGLGHELRPGLPPGDLPREPELDRRAAARPREQPADDDQAVRAAAASCRRLQKVVYSASGCSLAEKTYDEARRRRPRTARCRSSRTARTRSPRSSASSTASSTTATTVCRRCARASRTSTGPGEMLGAGGWRGTPATVWRNVVPTFVYRALKGLPLRLENGGQASRDFIFVDDIVEGLLRCGSLARPGDVYNLASGVETTIRELAETILRLTGSDVRAGARAAPRVGPRRAALRQHRQGARGARLRGRRAARGGAAPHRRVDAREPRPHRRLRRAPRGAARRRPDGRTRRRRPRRASGAAARRGRARPSTRRRAPG